MKEIPLTQGKVALVDDEDYDLVSRFKWCATKDGRTFYARRGTRGENGKWVTQRMHQLLMPGVKRIDHRDTNGLNNQRHNLRPATRVQNGQNRLKARRCSSAYKGVWRNGSKWRAEITLNGVRIYLGRFQSESDAARAYDAEAVKLFGGFALTNTKLGILPK